MDLRRVTLPAALFGIVLGLSGLGNDWRVAARLWGAPAWLGEAVMLVAGLVWLALMALYLQKWLQRGDEARAELAHPIQCCFIALVPVSTMLMGNALLPHQREGATLLLVVGIVAALGFGVWRYGGTWKGGRSDAATTPVLYLPTVAANFVAAIGLGSFGWPEVGQLFFGAGLLAWLAIESVLLHRLLMGEEMPVALRPTMGIQLAPPSVGLLAYVSVTQGPPDLMAHMLLGYALLQVLLLGRLLRWIVQLPLSAYWGFSFGLTAVAAATLRLVERGGSELLLGLGLVLFVIANVVVIGLSLATLSALFAGRLFPTVPAAPAAAPAAGGR